MGRINVEDSLFKDNRFIRLIIRTGSLDNALGAVVHVWMVAQKYWFPHRQPIPKKVWGAQGLNLAVVECGLAEDKGDGYQALGSEDQFAWLFAASKAGRASAESKGNSDNGVERPLTDDERVSTSSSFSYSSSSSFSDSKNENAHRKRRAKVIESNFDLEALYREYPRKKGKTPGLKKLAKDIQTPDDLAAFKLALERFKANLKVEKTAAEFIPYFSTFASSWRDWLDDDAGHAEGASGTGLDYSRLT